MAIIRDIIDLFDVVNTANKNKQDSGMIRLPGSSKSSFKSVTNATSDLILTFPVIVSKTIPVSTAVMVSKAIERKCTSLMQILFSAVALDSKDSVIDFVKQYHTNLNSNMTVDEFIGIMDDYVLNNARATSESAIIDKDVYEQIKHELKHLDDNLEEDLNEFALTNYSVDTNCFTNTVEVTRHRNAYTEADNGDTINRRAKETNRKVHQNSILNNDIKKANELMPTSLVIDYIRKTSPEDPGVMLSSVIGIKAKLYMIEADDIITRIKLKNSDRNGFNLFIRATTHEISFWKDLIFAIDRAKVDALSNAGRGSSSKMWKVLERRSLKSRIRRTLGQKNDASAITTLVISEAEVEYLKKNENIDIEKANVVRPIMESYNLMGFVIVDESIETAKFLFDTGDDDFEVMSYTNLEREASDTTYKKVVNLMTKVSR